MPIFWLLFGLYCSDPSIGPRTDNCSGPNQLVATHFATKADCFQGSIKFAREELDLDPHIFYRCEGVVLNDDPDASDAPLLGGH